MTPDRFVAPHDLLGWPSNMTTNQPVACSMRGTPPLALHIRRLRRFYGGQGLTQMELAQLVGISNCRLNIHEHRRTLPQMVRVLVALAIALDVSIEGLIDPRHLEQIRVEVEGRRQQLCTEKARRLSAKGGRRNHAQ